MGKKILGGVLVLLILVGGGGGYFALSGGEAQGREQIRADVEPPEFLRLAPITLPVLRGDRVRRLVAFGIVLELAPGRTPLEVKGRMHRVEDAFVTELAALLAVEWPGGQPIDLDIAKKRLMNESERVVGRGVVSEVLFEHFQIRAL